MYDENRAERWESGMKPFSNEWEYMTKNLSWLEKEFYKKQAENWKENA
tara:strand:- start:146 stop:289 length:144 start_codon:yes stop_codon:yes gene_type:complete